MQYKFQGKSLTTNKWLKGSHLKISGKDYIIPIDYRPCFVLNNVGEFDGGFVRLDTDLEVHPDSVGVCGAIRY